MSEAQTYVRWHQPTQEVFLSPMELVLTRLGEGLLAMECMRRRDIINDDQEVIRLLDMADKKVQAAIQILDRVDTHLYTGGTDGD